MHDSWGRGLSRRHKLSRKLSPAEENEARKAFAMLQNKKLLTVNKRGRPASMAPVHAALAIRKGAFAKNRGASLSAESQLTAAGTAYGGVPAKKIKEYLSTCSSSATLRSQARACCRHRSRLASGCVGVRRASASSSLT